MSTPPPAVSGGSDAYAGRDVVLDFEHMHAAHCESGAVCALLRHQGVKLSEPMAFGIGSGLFFLYLPFIRIYGAPLLAYRDAPNAIMRRVARRLGVRLRTTRFRDEAAGMRALDLALTDGHPAGLQTGVFWLPYFPRDMRFQFNGHHVVAFGREGDEYLLSDTVFEDVVRCKSEDLRRARFSKGPLAPRGYLYTIDASGSSPELALAVRAGIRTTVSRMLDIPLPWLGVRGIRALARAIPTWPLRIGEDKARLWLANVIRMQEEIGTGGAGFRFMYAAFLDEAAALLATPALRGVSTQFDEIGDRWRAFAVAGAQLIQDREAPTSAWQSLADRVHDCARDEQTAFKALRQIL